MYRDFSLHYVGRKFCKLFRAMCMIKLSRTFGKKGWSLKRPWLLIGAELFTSFGKGQS